MINEDQVELLAIDWFKELGYDYLLGYDIAPDSTNPLRDNYQEVIIKSRLNSALQKLNKNLPQSAIDEAIHILSKPQYATLIQNNREFHRLLLQGISVEIDTKDGKKGEVVKIIDFEKMNNNDFLVVNQFTIKGTKGNRRPDLIVFINGLPISVIELKNPADENADIYKAYNQLQTYKDEVEDLFVYNEALIISDGIHARVGSLTATEERFMFWRTIKNENDKPVLEYELDTLIKGFFEKKFLLDYIQNFVLFEDDGKAIIKKIAGYHQFHAVRTAVDTVIKASTTGTKKGGVVWHTQGSGKSISMACFAGKLTKQPTMKNPTLVIVTDRNDLDGQLYSTFCSAKMLLGQEPVQMDDVSALRDTLSGKPSGGIIFTTIQKFSLKKEEDRFPCLSDRSNIVVIADEAHRSQYGFDAMLDKDGKFKYGYAQHLRDALPNATFIGFTGTPIESEDKDTRFVFGDYISIYDIEDAVRDGATLPIYYESRLAKIDLSSDALKEIDSEISGMTEQSETSDREKFKSKWSALEKLVGSKARIQQVAKDIVTHFEDRTAAIDGKGMIVAMSRHIAVDLYYEIVAIRPDWHSEDPTKGAIKVIMTGSASDEAKMQQHIYSKQVKKDIEKRIKDVDDELKLVIVRDMWLTGFDAPSLHTMYIDKPMKSHNLMQAIARVNRVFKDKKGGLVVDYIGIANELKQALKTYTGAGGKGTGTIDSSEAFAELVKRLDIIQNMYHGFDYSEYMTKAHMLLPSAANHVLGLDDGKKRYLDEVLAMTKAFSLCGTLDEAKEYKEEIAFFQAVKSVIQKASVVGVNKRNDPNKVIKQLIDNAVVSGGVDDIFSMVGLDKPDISILSDEFLQDVANIPHKNLAVELLEKLLKDDIKAKTKNNVVQEKKFSDRLQATLGKYNNRAIETAQVIEELIAMAKEFAQESKKGADLGLNFDELAFYDALAENESALLEMGDDTLKKIAVELTQKLRNSISVDWQKRESVRAKMRNIIRILLKRYKYPPDMSVMAIDMVMKQAEVLSDEWSS